MKRLAKSLLRRAGYQLSPIVPPRSTREPTYARPEGKHGVGNDQADGLPRNGVNDQGPIVVIDQGDRHRGNQSHKLLGRPQGERRPEDQISGQHDARRLLTPARTVLPASATIT
jgi:hypothetical protein